jgi:hypothetical protein
LSLSFDGANNPSVLLKDNAGWKERSLDGLFETWIDNAKERTPSLDEWFVLLKDIAGWGECSLDGLFAHN